MDKKVLSYTSANSYPLKILKNTDLITSIASGRIVPLHVQLIPTNKCNLSCSFCSCSARDKSLELPMEYIIKLLDDLVFLGTKAITITGGGEPILYPHLKDLLLACYARRIDVGLVTNGLRLDLIDAEALSILTWCRISCCDERCLSRLADNIIRDAVKRGPGVDWAFSYVIGHRYNLQNLADYIYLANELNFSHVRVVSDIIDHSEHTDLPAAKKALLRAGYDDSRVIYQSRSTFEPGSTDCLISLLKPVIGADGYIYPCCGVQYAHKDQDLDMATNMRMGHMKDIVKIMQNQEWFNGGACFRCYYKNYNDILSALTADIDHVRFV